MNQPEETTFNFDMYLAKDSENLPKIGPIDQNESFDFDRYVVESPSPIREATRHISRTGARIVESIAGFPGDVVDFVKFLNEKAPKTPDFLKGTPTFTEKLGRQALEKLPNSEQLKEFSSYLTKGFTDPKSASEEFGDEVSSLATILFNPSKAIAGFKSLLKEIGKVTAKATATKGAGMGAETLGASEGQKQGIELGTLFLTGLFGKKSAEKLVKDKYQKARSAIPEGTIVPTHNLEESLNALDQILAKGVSTPTKNEVRKSLSELKAKASGGVMEIDEIVQSTHDINEIINSKKLFDELNTSERKLLKSRYDLLKGEIYPEIEKYGRNNPEFYSNWKEANETHATIAQSKKVSNFLQSKLGKMPQHLIGSLALDLFLGHPATIIGVGGGYSAVKLGELLYKIAKSPTLRDNYTKALFEAGNENLPGFIKNVEKIERAEKGIK